MVVQIAVDAIVSSGCTGQVIPMIIHEKIGQAPTSIDAEKKWQLNYDYEHNLNQQQRLNNRHIFNKKNLK